MKKLFAVLPILLMMSLLSSCEVEFSPNGDYLEVPVVYCVLDQGVDTTWVRVQKCYLSQDNFYSYTSVKDSTNYRQGDISVKLIKWRAYRATPTSTFLVIDKSYTSPLATIDLQYVERVKDSGLFNYQIQPMYGAYTRGFLDSNCVYQLVVLRSATGDTIAQAQTSLLGNGGKLTKVNNFALNSHSALFKFVGTQNNCSFTWTPWTRARLYQPTIRFYYKENNELKHVDVSCAKIKDYGRAQMLTATLSEGTYFGQIEQALRDDNPAPKTFVHHVDIMMDACNENLNAYIHSVNASHSGSQNSQIYTNIENGIGVFASKRSFATRVPSDSAVDHGSYIDKLWNMHIGFEKNI